MAKPSLTDMESTKSWTSPLFPEKVPETNEEMILYIEEYIEKYNYLADGCDKAYMLKGGEWIILSEVFHRSIEFAQLMVKFLLRQGT